MRRIRAKDLTYSTSAVKSAGLVVLDGAIECLLNRRCFIS